MIGGSKFYKDKRTISHLLNSDRTEDEFRKSLTRKIDRLSDLRFIQMVAR